MGKGDDSVVKKSLTTQTAEEAARDKYHGGRIDLPPYLIEDLRSAFIAGAKWQQEREKVLGERWVIVNPDGRVIDFGKSENEAWQNVLTIARYAVEDFKAQGYRAVKVKLVEVVE